jgi:hypothetical protein
VILGLVLLGFTVWVLTRRPNEIIHDSRDFTEALEIWQPVIGRQYRTPREIKRFLNRVRYIAMRWRKPSPQKTVVERFVDWLGRAKVDHEQAVAINEAEIVLMAAVEGVGGWMKAFNNDADVKEALGKHGERFGQIRDEWERYRKITGEVEVN